MSELKYICNRQGNPVPENDSGKWERWMRKNRRRKCLFQKQIGSHVQVSTVFLGLDHRYVDENPENQINPLLWETMIFGGILDDYQGRFSGTRQDAKAMHDMVVQHMEIVEM